MSMTNTTDWTEMQQAWLEQLESANEQFADAIEKNLDAQTRFVDAWMESIDERAGQDVLTEGFEGAGRAYETWMRAAHDTVEQTTNAMEGEDVRIEQFRDIWLNAANRAFKDVMGTAAFSAATGQTVDQLLEIRQQADEIAEMTLHDVGLPTDGDLKEVGERLVELERRQHAVENKLDGVEDKLDRVLAALESESEEAEE